jgi:hypothetical protein
MRSLRYCILGSEQHKVVTSHKGSITDIEDVTKALTGVNSVIHVAGLVRRTNNDLQNIHIELKIE